MSEIDPDDVRRFDQGAAWLADNLPPQWRRMYDNCIKEGFDTLDSLALVKAYIISQGQGDKRP
jgi:hypothetical protein